MLDHHTILKRSCIFIFIVLSVINEVASQGSCSPSNVQHFVMSNTDETSADTDVIVTEENRSSPAVEPGIWSGQHLRSPLARAVYNKMKEDERNKNDRHVYWYRVVTSRFSPELQSRFIQFDQDQGTDQFLENCLEKSNQVFTQLFYSLARPVLNFFMSQTSINGFLYRGSMFVFSKAQFEKLLHLSPYYKGENLLDLGAGDGMVTKQMSSYFYTTYATEMSGVMVRRLTADGFNCLLRMFLTLLLGQTCYERIEKKIVLPLVLGVDEWSSNGMKYDLISCLNLLDRCDKPFTLLADIRKSLKPDVGRVLVAMVIPFKPYVEFGSKTHQPTEHVNIRGSNFEEQVEQFDDIFRKSGFEVENFTRLPYLCEGDLRHTFYMLTDAVFVLKASGDAP